MRSIRHRNPVMCYWAVLTLVCGLYAGNLERPVSAQENPKAARLDPAQVLVSKQRVIFDSSFLSGSSKSEWSNGFIVSREIETFAPGSTNVRLYDRTGQKIREAVVWFPGARRVLLKSAVADPEGNIVVSGSTEKADGTTAPFIARTDLTGKVSKVIQTTRIDPSQVCLAPNGTTWAFGGTGYEDTGLPKPGNTLRQFDFDKGEIGAYIPRSTFPRLPMPNELAQIACLPTSVVIYSGRAHEYIELEYATGLARRYKVEGPSGLWLAGFAALGPRKVFGELANPSNQNDARTGLYSLAIDENAMTARWVPIIGAVGDQSQVGTITSLWGADGDSLVFSRVGDVSGKVAIHWATPPTTN